MINVERLSKRFGSRLAVNDLSFEVEKGTVLGFLGPNGAGKTTSMRMITGYLTPTEGRVHVQGIDVQRDPVEARRYIGYLPENAPLYDDMTVTDFLRFIAEIRGYRGKERIRKTDEVIEKTFLQNVQYQTIDTLSKGYRQRTALAQAILHDPQILILDEPTEGLDPNQKSVVRTMIGDMAREKVIIFSTHVLEEVASVCTRVIIISDGKLVADETPQALKSKSVVHNAVSVEIAKDDAKFEDVLRRIQNVDRVEHLPSRNENLRLRVFPSSGGAITAGVLDAASTNNVRLENVTTEDGRLDEVFMSLTTTDDVVEAARKGEE